MALSFTQQWIDTTGSSLTFEHPATGTLTGLTFTNVSGACYFVGQFTAPYAYRALSAPAIPAYVEAQCIDTTFGSHVAHMGLYLCQKYPMPAGTPHNGLEMGIARTAGPLVKAVGEEGSADVGTLGGLGAAFAPTYADTLAVPLPDPAADPYLLRIYWNPSLVDIRIFGNNEHVLSAGEAALVYSLDNGSTWSWLGRPTMTFDPTLLDTVGLYLANVSGAGNIECIFGHIAYALSGTGPFIDKINPTNSETSVSQDAYVEIDIKDVEDDLDINTVIITIEGRVAWTGDAAGTDFSTSFKTAISGGYRYTLICDTHYCANSVISVRVQAEDSAANQLDETINFTTSTIGNRLRDDFDNLVVDMQTNIVGAGTTITETVDEVDYIENLSTGEGWIYEDMSSYGVAADGVYRLETRCVYVNRTGLVTDRLIGLTLCSDFVNNFYEFGHHRTRAIKLHRTSGGVYTQNVAASAVFTTLDDPDEKGHRYRIYWNNSTSAVTVQGVSVPAGFVSFWYSLNDGTTWTQLYQEAATFTPTKFGIFLKNGNTGNCYAKFDWLTFDGPQSTDPQVLSFPVGNQNGYFVSSPLTWSISNTSNDMSLEIGGLDAIVDGVVQTGWDADILANGFAGYDISILALSDYFAEEISVPWYISTPGCIFFTEAGSFDKDLTSVLPSGFFTWSTGSALQQANADTDGIYAPINVRTPDEIGGWRWDKTSWLLDSTKSRSKVPALFDSSLEGITQQYFRSGIGGGRDLELIGVDPLATSGFYQTPYRSRLWVPEIYHGNYFLFSGRNYLHSDDSTYDFPTYANLLTGLEDDFSFIQLDYYPKVGVPVIARQWQWNESTGKYQVYREARQKPYFTGKQDSDGSRLETYDDNKEAVLFENIDQTKDEFILSYSGETASSPKLIFNKQVSSQIGDGTVDGSVLLGYSDGDYSQQFYLPYSPVDRYQPIDIYSHIGTSGTFESWTSISGLNTGLLGYQVGIDYDLGIIQFPASGFTPQAGWSIGANYHATFEVEYESENDIDTLSCIQSDTNPIRRHTDRGFIYITDELEDVTSLVLSADLTELANNIFGPLYIGNNYGPVIATAYGRDDRTIEGATIVFEIISDPASGFFSGNQEDIEAITNENGEAKTYYHAPSTVDEIGEYITTAGVIDPTPTDYPGVTKTTTLSTSTLYIEGSEDDVFLFQVLTDDPLSGYRDDTVADMESAQLNKYYKDFFTDQGIFGPVGNNPITGEPQTGAVTWESWHRAIWGLAQPQLFNGITYTGKKILLVTEQAGVLNPHTFTDPAIAPFQPIDIISTGAGAYNIVYNTSSYTLPVIGANQVYGYFIIAPTSVEIQAKTYNSRLKRWIVSNSIRIKLTIPPEANGLWLVDELNSISTEEISSILAAMDPADVIGKKIPLGFRLRSPNVTLAGALGGVTFLDVNERLTTTPWPPLRIRFTVV